MSDAELLEIIKTRISDKNGKKTLSCGAAHEINKEFAAGLFRIGEICNRENIKISACELGCFK